MKTLHNIQTKLDDYDLAILHYVNQISLRDNFYQSYSWGIKQGQLYYKYPPHEQGLFNGWLLARDRFGNVVINIWNDDGRPKPGLDQLVII